MGIVFVDVEAWNGAPSVGQMTEFGAVTKEGKTFYGFICASEPDPANPTCSLEPKVRPTFQHELKVATEFAEWLSAESQGRPIFVSDNNGYDYQWINDLFWRTLGYNPFGHSSRRIGDFYAGLVGDFHCKSKWKKLRITKHDHNPVHDALGNLEAFRRLLKGER